MRSRSLTINTNWNTEIWVVDHDPVHDPGYLSKLTHWSVGLNLIMNSLGQDGVEPTFLERFINENK